jgi:carboxypeptidase family protein
MFRAVPVPGATVTAMHGNERRVTNTDQQGGYRFADLADGVWTIRVEMLGFSSLSRDVTVGPDTPVVTWDMTLLPFDEIARGLPPAAAAAPEPPRAPIAGRRAGTVQPQAAQPGGFQRAQVNASPGAGAIAADPASADADRNQSAADGFLINGSVNNGAASPFAQLAAFGNNRRGTRSLYNGGLGVILGNSAWDAQPFTFGNAPAPELSYSDVQVVGSFAGPLKIPGIIRNGPTLFLGYQRTVAHNASTQSGLVPTVAERTGDFSRTADPSGRPVQILDPATGAPFPGNVIPAGRLSPQAAALLRYYPLPNVDGTGQFNYQTPTIVSTHQDALQTRFTKVFDAGRNQLFGTVALQRTTTDASNLFGFVDSTRLSGVDATINWSHRFSQFHSIRLRYQFTRLATEVLPQFAFRTNVSGDAGIAGNDQNPINWGPPRLIFSSGVAGLASAQAADNHDDTHAAGIESQWTRGRHIVTFGGDARRQLWDVYSQQDPRGTFGFTGALTGLDLADFLLGVPHTSAIASGNPDKYFRAPAYDAYVTDDWRVNPVLTVNAGVRWEYEAPIEERFSRLVNLDVAPGFGAAGRVLASDPVGTVTGTRYPESLMRPDPRGVQPRVGLALRPVAGSSLVIRAGYGVYRNTAVYEPIALLLAQQQPLSTSFSVENSVERQLTLANGFAGVGGTASNTFAVDPDFRVGYTHSWQVLVQRDLPASLTMTGTYLGGIGRHLVQEFLPNSVPPGAENPCPACPLGFVYLASNGHSDRQAGQLQLRRRLRDGFSASVAYTLSKATDDAGAFTGVRLDGAAIAQDWQHLEAEDGPSSFDQRHLIAAQFQYTTGVGLRGGALLDGVRARLFNGWTITGQLNAGSGLPLTPVYLAPVTGTGVTGTIRPDLVVAAAGSVADGSYANRAAYVAPAAGHWGSAGRNSITGPAQFAFDAGVGRSFLWGERLTLDWRLNATNVLNRVTYAAVNTIVGSPQFGLPTVANPMRKVQSTLRVRF